MEEKKEERQNLMNMSTSVIEKIEDQLKTIQVQKKEEVEKGLVEKIKQEQELAKKKHEKYIVQTSSFSLKK